MNAEIVSRSVNITAVAPPSKSASQRLILAAALKKGVTLIKNVGGADDISAMTGCLSSLGAKITRSGGDLVVEGIKTFPEKVVLDCKESGATYRFLIPVVAASGVNANFTGSEKLLSRPLGNLVNELEKHGEAVNGNTFSGRISSGEYVIDASVTSQTASGLLFALPLVRGVSSLCFTEKPVSEKYLDMTYSVLDLSGIRYEKSGYKTIIEGKQTYSLPDTVEVSGDWSAAAFLLVIGTICGCASVSGLSFSDGQGDKAIVDILRTMNADIAVKGDKVEVRRSQLKGIKLNCEDIPDLVMPLVAAAVFADGESEFTGIERLKYKESDRLESLTGLMKACGAKYETDGKTLKVYGKTYTRGGAVSDGKNDHRVVMAATAIALGVGGESVVSNAESVKKSYPDFFGALGIEI